MFDPLFLEKLDGLVHAAPEQGLPSECSDELGLPCLALLLPDGEGDWLLRHDLAATHRQFDDRQPIQPHTGIAASGRRQWNGGPLGLRGEYSRFEMRRLLRLLPP